MDGKMSHSCPKPSEPCRKPTASWALPLLFALASKSLPAQTSDPAALAAVRVAVQSELRANQNDHTLWIYVGHDTTAGKDIFYQAVQTPQGELHRTVQRNGKTLSGSAEAAETLRIQEFVHDPSAQAKERKNGEHDDEQAAALLKMLPDAFLWTIAAQNPELVTLDFKPNPAFSPPDMEARVMSTMAGQMVIARNGDRIRTLRGQLTDDVRIGYGLLGKLNRGGTFDVERREIAPGRWQITETRVHIGGHALLFKTIGQQEDEIKTDWKPSTDATLEAAARTLHAEN